MQIKLSNATNWNDMISTFTFESETEIYALVLYQTWLLCIRQGTSLLLCIMSKQWLDVKPYKCILY